MFLSKNSKAPRCTFCLHWFLQGQLWGRNWPCILHCYPGTRLTSASEEGTLIIQIGYTNTSVSWNTGFVPAAHKQFSRYPSRRHRARAANKDPHFSLKWPASPSSSPLHTATREWEPLTHRHRTRVQKVTIYLNISCVWGSLLWVCFLTGDIQEGRTRSEPQLLFVCRGNTVHTINPAKAPDYLPWPTKCVSENISCLFLTHGN